MSLPTREQISAYLESTLTPMVEEGPPPLNPPEEIKEYLDDLVTKGQTTVRDGIVTLLAMELVHGEVIDWRRQTLHNPARSASRFLGSKLYPRLHIAGSPEALQTGVKGTGTYLDRSNRTWKGVLLWASAQDDLSQVEAAYLYLGALIAATAKAVPDLPEIDTPRLTFSSLFELLDDMLANLSGGAHEQLIFAAFLEAWRDQEGLDGVVETKHINAADASAGTAADVQVRVRGQVIEAYEITAEPFERKIDQALRALRQNDLRRVHILAKGVRTAPATSLSAIIPESADLSVLDVREEIRSLVARLNKPHRREGVTRLYRLLVDKQPNDALVRDFVEGLAQKGLVAVS
jgi:hypothetical protein